MRLPRWVRSLVVAALTVLAPVARAEGLLELYLRALESNPLLRIRAFGVEQATAQKDLARSRLLPRVYAVGSYNRNDYEELDLDRRYTGKRGSLVGRQALFDLASYYRLRGAQTDITQSEQERQATEMQIGGELIDRYLTVLQAEDELVHVGAEKEAIRTQLQRLRAMRERQLAKVTDVLEVDAYQQGLLTREIELRNARAVGLERLREIAGVTVQQVAPLVRETLPPVPGTETQWLADSVAGNPALAALGTAIESARLLITSVRSEHLPTVSLAATQTYSDQGYDNRAVPTYRVGTVGIEVNIPIFEGGRVQASVRDAVARHQIAREEYEATRREIEGKVRTAYLSAQASNARIGSTEAETRALERVVESQQRSYEVGVTTVVDVLIARQRLIKARSDYSKARYDYIRDLSVLRVQSGAMNRSNMEEIDSWLARPRP